MLLQGGFKVDTVGGLGATNNEASTTESEALALHRVGRAADI